jgi:hypothetical protein
MFTHRIEHKGGASNTRQLAYRILIIAQATVTKGSTQTSRLVILDVLEAPLQLLRPLFQERSFGGGP